MCGGHVRDTSATCPAHVPNRREAYSVRLLAFIVGRLINGWTRREAYSVRLLDAESWATEASYALREDEWVMCMRLLPLRDAAPRAVTHRLVD